MSIAVGVNIRRSKTLVYCDPHSVYLDLDNRVLIETENGLECGTVVRKEGMINDNHVKIYKLIRKLEEKDYARLKDNKYKEKRAYNICMQKIKERELAMKLVCVEYTYDRAKLFIYYTADGRVDFREIIKEFGYILKTKIQMVQIGVRDEAKIIGSYGHCGHEVCCRRYLRDFKPVVVEMAKEQGLSLSPSKISGACGRLICCLSYEDCFYKEMKKKVPKIGSKVKALDGTVGHVKSVNILKEEVELTLEEGMTKKYPLKDIKK